jgi:hypothetical protein
VSKTTAGAHASTQPQENIVKAAAIYWYDVFDRFRIGLSQPKIAKLFLREHLQDPQILRVPLNQIIDQPSLPIR